MKSHVSSYRPVFPPSLRRICIHFGVHFPAIDSGSHGISTRGKECPETNFGALPEWTTIINFMHLWECSSGAAGQREATYREGGTHANEGPRTTTTFANVFICDGIF